MFADDLDGKVDELEGKYKNEEISVMLEEKVTVYGIRRLIKKYEAEFNKMENLLHYSTEDYRKAEKKYVAFRLKMG